MKLAIFSLRSAASFKNQCALLYRAAVKWGWECVERDLLERVIYPKERFDRLIVLGPLWPRYVFEAVRLSSPWLSSEFWLYGPVDGPYLQNVTFEQVVKNTIREERVAVPSQFCKEMLIRSGLTPGLVVPHGIDLEDFRFDEAIIQDRLEKLREKFPGKTIFFSNINPIHRKGFPQLRAALAILQEKRPHDWVFILHTGRGKALDLAPGLDKIPSLVIEDAYNALPFREIALKNLTCDVFVWPSLLEGFGLTVLEAMAAKRPIVSSDVPAHNELLDPKSAWLVPMTDLKQEQWQAPGCMAQLHHYDPADLARAMESAMDHPKERREKAERAFDRAKNYDYMKVYEPFVKR